MSNSSRGKDGQAKQENETSGTKLPKKTASTTPSRQWAAFRNPRIVRVSRSFGGKDRHSKVCTIKGLRDRRIRLSVPSAIMLYDLQHKLGLGQPSKVVDWLLNEAKHEIDKLPPLPFPPEEYFSQFNPKPKPLIPHHLNAPQSSLSPFFHANSEFNKDGGIRFNDSDGDHNPTFVGKSKYWTDHSDADSRVKSKGVEKENIIDHNKWYISRFTTNVQENQGDDVNGDYIPQFSAQNLFPLANQFSFPSLLSSNTSSYNWDPSNLSLSQFGNQSFLSQADLHSTSLQILPSLSHPCPPFVNSSIENDPRQSNNHFQLLCSTSQQHLVPNSLVSPFHFISPFNVNPKVTNSATNNDTTK